MDRQKKTTSVSERNGLHFTPRRRAIRRRLLRALFTLPRAREAEAEAAAVPQFYFKMSTFVLLFNESLSLRQVCVVGVGDPLHFLSLSLSLPRLLFSFLILIFSRFGELVRGSFISARSTRIRLERHWTLAACDQPASSWRCPSLTITCFFPLLKRQPMFVLR